MTPKNSEVDRPDNVTIVWQDRLHGSEPAHPTRNRAERAPQAIVSKPTTRVSYSELGSKTGATSLVLGRLRVPLGERVC